MHLPNHIRLMSNKSQIFYFNILVHTFIVLKTVLKAHFMKSLTFEITLIHSRVAKTTLPFSACCCVCMCNPPVFLEYTVASAA